MNRPDITMMILVHNAFRRELRRFRSAAADSVDNPEAFAAVRDGWRTFNRYLTVHHTVEDEILWPALQSKLSEDSIGTALLIEMAAEHARLDPLLSAIDADLADGRTADLAARFDNLAEVLEDHLTHEETAALPLVTATLTVAQWRTFGDEQRRRIGIRGGAWFFPWLLDGAEPAARAWALALLPPPLRLIYRYLWQPRYARRSPWRSRPDRLAPIERKSM
ncbi:MULTISPECIES: hemerythrin domain-containing protein [unclassified Nocardia]|uniref:hemerythrin domain-containing protein n=1 Tax=unclassified Nocardia TaxID=2637762 RepID=UPI001CE47E28|nr:MULTISPECIES: hemerythrin domain-containing protein [unclassified Nocardia]